jgi:hypothetical protein
METQKIGLSNVQLELLKLYANNISEQSLIEIRQVLAEYFAQKATEAMDTEWEQRGLTPEDMIQWTNEHKRHENRTDINIAEERKEKILKGLEIAYANLLEFKKSKNSELVILKDNKIVKIKM